MVHVRSHLVVVKVGCLELTALSFEERTTCTTSETPVSGVWDPQNGAAVRTVLWSGYALPPSGPPAKLVVVNTTVQVNYRRTNGLG